ncbi:MAG: bacteriohemerythrin [bacterium]
MAIQWTEDLSVGVDEIDNQHKELFNRINKLLDACNQGEGRNVVAEVIKFLEDYVIIHFGTEEEYMTKHGYLNYLSHKAQHTGFIKDFSALKKQFEAGGATLGLVVRTNHTVVDWIIKHISKTDKALGAFLKTKM